MSQTAPGLHIRVEFKAADCWVGVFWKRRHWWCGACPIDEHGYQSAASDGHRRWDVWICLLPMLPLHIWRERGQHDEYVPEPCLECGMFHCEDCYSYVCGDTGGGRACCCGRISDPPEDDEDYSDELPEVL